MPEREAESNTTPARAPSFLPVESWVTESCEKAGIASLSAVVAGFVTHSLAANTSVAARTVLRTAVWAITLLAIESPAHYLTP
jgi:hypothetical protein